MTRLIAAAIALVALAVAWAAHDLTRTWNNSLRLPADDA